MKHMNILGLVLLYSASACAKTPLYAMYTPSHRVLVEEWFLPSIQDDFDLRIREFPQECPSGNAFMPGFNKTVKHKLEMCLEAIEENWGNIFIFSDVDIIFFAPVEKTITSLMRDYDLLIQRDDPKGQPCSGFFVCRANDITKKLFINALELYQTNPKISGDQEAICHFFYDTNKMSIKWALLPTSFCSGGTFTAKMWKPGNDLPIPQELHLFHASYANGIKNKIEMFKYVQEAYHHKK